MLNPNSSVAGTIQPDKLNVFVIKGIQFEGIILQADDTLRKQVAKEYYLKYPMALAMQGDIWVIRLENIKMTDSTLSFGKKIFWKRNEVMAPS
jgi:uncharacterized protein YhbP (UPF0306 family)